jgi:hypothetical protein
VKRWWWFLLVWAWLAASGWAQDAGREAKLDQGQFNVEARVERGVWELGESVRLVYRISGPTAGNITFPASDKVALKPFEVKDAAVVALPQQGDRRTWEYRLKITAYETGNLTLPELTLPVRTPGEAGTAELRTPALTLQVNRVPTKEGDQPQQVRDAKGLREQPIPPAVLLAALFVVLLVALLLYQLVRWLRRPKVAPAPPALPPYPWALREWQELHDQRPDREGHWEKFYEKMTHMLRFYLGWRFKLPLLELTSSEILRALSLPDAAHRFLKEILDTADLVKFARIYPSPERGEQHLVWSRELLESNAPAETEKVKT